MIVQVKLTASLTFYGDMQAIRKAKKAHQFVSHVVIKKSISVAGGEGGGIQFRTFPKT